VTILTTVLAIAVVAFGGLVLLLVYAAHTHSPARWQEAVAAHNRAATLRNLHTGEVIIGEDAAA
jgi:hypothetical protein